MKFKIGDKIKIKKLSREVYNKVITPKKHFDLSYDDYLELQEDIFGKIFTISNINNEENIYNIYESEIYFFEEELLSIIPYKKIIRSILK